jgi:hypothetical protein
MTKQKNRMWLAALLVCGITISGCSNKDDSAGDLDALSANDSILRFVPANTPYVMANTAPLSDALYDKLEPKMDALLEAYQVVAKETMRPHMDAVQDDVRDAEDTERLAAIVDELSSLFSVSGIREAGIGRDSTFAIYGNGLLPVLRIQLSDGAAFEAAVARIEEEAGSSLETAELDGKSYRFVDADEARFVVAVFGDQAILTVAPSAFDDSQLSQLLGLTLPAQSIAASGELQEIAKEFGFTNQYLGLISMERIASTFLDGPTGLDVDVLALAEDGIPELSDVCTAEIRSMVGIIPRMVLGYTRLDDEIIDTSVIVELRPDIALGLSALPAAVPGLGQDFGGLMSFGFGLNPLAAREFYESRLDAMEADPYKCELLQELQAGVSAGREVLNQPLPPMVYDFKGFLANIDEIEGMDMMKQTPPTSISGQLLIAMDNVQALVAMGSMFSPQVAELNLQPDSKPVPLNLPQIPGTIENPYVAMSDNALVIATGNDAQAKIAALLEAEVAEQPPFTSVAIDANKYYALVGEAIAAGGDDVDDEPSPEMQKALQDAMDALSTMYDRMVMDVRFTSRGIEIDGEMTIGE